MKFEFEQVMLYSEIITQATDINSAYTTFDMIKKDALNSMSDNDYSFVSEMDEILTYCQTTCDSGKRLSEFKERIIQCLQRYC